MCFPSSLLFFPASSPHIFRTLCFIKRLTLSDAPLPRSVLFPRGLINSNETSFFAFLLGSIDTYLQASPPAMT